MDRPLRDRLRQAYDAGADERDGRSLPDWRLAEREGFLMRLQEHRLETLLEVGAGAGHDAQFFAESGCKVTCIDLSFEMVKRCRAKNLQAEVMDVLHLSFRNESFDAAYSVNCLLHLPGAELSSALREIHRVLRRGGLFFYGTWGGFEHEGVYEDDHLHPPRLFSFHDDETLRRLTGEAFDVLEQRSAPRDPKDARFRFQSLLLRRTS
jgi:SAM-dependent methyltransferase